MLKSIFDLDMTPNRTLPLIVNVSQYDDIGRTLVFNLFSSSGKWTAPTSAAVTFEGGKPDGKFFAYNCAYSNGTVTVTIQQQMTAVAGKVRCKIKVTSGDKVVESAPIIMVVDAAAVPDGSDMSKSDINDAIANATQKIVDQVKDNIPSDYSQLSTDVSSLKQDLGNKIISSANLFDKAKLTSGFYTTSVSGIKISDNPAYKCLLLDVKANETYTATGWGYTFSFYDKNGIRDTVNKVGTSTQSKENITFTVPSNAVKMSVNLRIDTNDIDSYMIVSGNAIPIEYIPFQNVLYASPYVEKKDVKEMISAKEYHVGKNQQFTSFIECLKSIQGDNSAKTVYIHEGSYDIFTELGGRKFLQTISSDAMWYNVSIIIPPNTKIIGIGLAELNYLPDASLIPSDNAVTCISPINVRGNASIENITINAKNCRYCIHDEPSGLDEFNENVKTFKNVRCKKIRNDYIPVSKVISGQAYAAGLNKRSILLFENCVFESEDSIAWSAHNRSFGANDGANITLKDCIFIGGAPSYGCVRLGNSSNYKSHSHVDITGCYLNGKFVIKDETEGIFYNTFDVKLLNCTDITVETSFSTDNEYPVKVYNSIVSH